MNSGVFKSAESTAKHVAIAGFLLSLWLGAIQYFAHGVSAWSEPFPTSRSEAFVLDGVIRVRNGDVLYLPIAEAPTTLHVYNPFTYTLPAWVAWPFEARPETLLHAGRLISLVATIGLSIVLGFWAWQTYRSIAAVLFVAAAPLYFHEIALTQFFRLRPETPAMLASVAAIVVMLWRDLNIRRIWFAAGLCLLAFLFKQSFIAAPLAIAVFLGMQRQWQMLLGFCGAYAGSVVLFLLVMFLATGNAYFENAIIAMATNDLHLIETMKTYAGYFLGNSWGLLFSAMVAAAYSVWISKNNLILIFWIIAGAWNIYSSGKMGSSANYYAEFAAATVLLTTHALFVTGSTCETKPAKVLRALVWLPLAVQILVGAGQGFTPRLPVLYRDDVGVDLSSYVARYGTNQEKLILHEKIAIQLGHPAGYDWYLLDILTARGMFNPQPLLRKIACAEYATVVFSTKPYSQIEQEIYQRVIAGRYRVVYQDATVVEFQRQPPSASDSNAEC